MRRSKVLDTSKILRGLDRKAHFENGGTLEGWRGRHLVIPDKKKQANKRACRGRVGRQH